MQNTLLKAFPLHSSANLRPAPQADFTGAGALYQALYQDQPSAQAIQNANTFLQKQLQVAQNLPADLPEQSSDLVDRIESATAAVGQAYRDYLARRKAGAAREYFTSKAHALHYLNAVAPTKLVDGAWLYSALQHEDDQRYASLVQTYLDELGNGMAQQNHVLLYRQLLASHGCNNWQKLDDCYFAQGAIQLALAHCGADYLPEVIGFNLGYEQLPFHLLITAYELNELGIDPYYFTLHVTVDNASSGHARQAAQAVLDAMPRFGDRQEFYRRVTNGYLLNQLGLGTEQIIDQFDLEKEVIAIFVEKSAFGKNLHSNYCRVAGRSVNDWLSSPDQIPGFLNALEQAGWIKRNQPVANSRFWQLIQGERAEMFGVFNAYEQQMIHDWIVGDSLQRPVAPVGSPVELNQMRQPSFRALQRQREALQRRRQIDPDTFSKSALDVDATSKTELALVDSDKVLGNQEDSEIAGLNRQLATASRAQALQLLIPLIGPATHHLPIGLEATQRLVRMLN